MAIMRGNIMNVRPGGPAFDLSTNRCDHFELGESNGDDYWLHADIVGDAEFLFNGRVYMGGNTGNGTIIDNFPKGPAPEGWTKVQRDDGYDLINDQGQTLFGFKVRDNICFVTVNVYAADGTLIAESLQNEFKVHRGPALIGRGGIRIG